MSTSIILPEDKLPPLRTAIAGIQHVIAMFGATVLAPLLMGFNPNVAIFFSGIATLLFLVLVRGRVPSYLGSSFAFIGPVIAATSYTGSGPNLNIDVALGGIIAAGAIYAAIGLIVQIAGSGWINRLLPPVVTGTIVAVIGLNLAPIAVKGISGSGFDLIIGFTTILAVALCAVYLRGFAKRLPILVGGVAVYIGYYLVTNIGQVGTPIDFSAVQAASFFGLPAFHSPKIDWSAIALIAPVALVLIAENLGHIKAIGAMTNRNFDPYIGRAFMGDGIATMIAAVGGGTGVTTYAENMGVMALTQNFAYRTFVAAALCAIFLGLSPAFGALLQTIPTAILGGLSFVVFGLITATGGRIWVQNAVDFSDPRNLVTVGIGIVMGAGDLAIDISGFKLGGITTATFSTIIIYHLLSLKRS